MSEDMPEKAAQLKKVLAALETSTSSWGAEEMYDEAIEILESLIAEQSAAPATTLTREDLRRLCVLQETSCGQIEEVLDSWCPWGSVIDKEKTNDDS